MATHSNILPGKSLGQRSLVGYIPGVTKSQTRLSRHARTCGGAQPGFSSCGPQALEIRSVVVVQTNLAAPGHVGSSQIRDRTHVSCSDGRILYH